MALNKHSLNTILILLGSIVFGQSYSPNIIDKVDKNEIMMHLSRDYYSTLKINNNKIDVISKYSESSIYISKNSITSNQRKIYSSELNPIKNIKAEQYNFNGKKYQKIKVDDPNLSFQPHAESFYDDTKVYTINYNNLKTYSITKHEYETEYTEPRLYKMFYIDDFYDTDNYSNTIKCDKNIKLCFEYYNISKDDIEYSEKTEGKYIIYTWKKNNLKKIDFQKNNINYRYYCAAIGVRICSMNINDSSKVYLTSTKDLYDWYHSLTDEVSNKNYSNVKKVTDSITRNITSDLDKIKKIYYYVQENISYIAIEDGMSGFIPRSPELILEKKIGDCKDMATLIYNMAKSQNITCYLTWVGTRDLPHKYQDNPTPYNDNHMIVSYIDENNKIYFLDATSKENHFNYHSGMIQGKEGLIGISKEKYQISEIPIIKAELNKSIDTLITNLSNNSILTGKRKLYLTGLERTEIIYNKGYHRNKNTFLINFHKDIIIANNKTLYNNPVIENNKKENYFKINEDIIISDYVSKLNNEYVFNPILVKNIFEFVNSFNQDVDFHFENLLEKNYYYETTFPENLKATEIPSNKQYKDPYFSYEIIYNVEDRTIKSKVKYTINTLNINKENREYWKKFSESIISDINQSIVLKTKN